MQGLDDVLAAAAEATQLALAKRQAAPVEASRTESTMTDLAALESLFIETLSNGNGERTGNGYRLPCMI